mmetsp:Transcript_38984/g.74670  ORF Transcript_38984/g.74670 Transcript_38984/m.74670 type:complete len:216 (+) Transcript_38984:737-1384(+)
MHGLDHVLFLEFELRRCLRLEHPTTTHFSTVHLHLLGIDGFVNNHPCAAPNLGLVGNVHHHRLLENSQVVNNHAAVLEHLPKHISQSACKTSPVGEYDQWQAFQVEVLDGLSCFERAVWEPNLTRLLLHQLLSSCKGRVCGDHLLHHSILNRYNAYWKASEPTPSRDHSLAPLCHALLERVLVEHGLQHQTRVVRRPGWEEIHQPLDGVPCGCVR